MIDRRIAHEYVVPFSFGALLCLVIAMWLSPGGEADWLWEYWDQSSPVVVGRAESVAVDGDGIKVHIVGEKLRACTFVGIHSYAIEKSGRQALIGIARVDRPLMTVTRPLGPADFGYWRVWPIAGAIKAEVWVTYRCSSRVVLNRLAEVPL